MNYNEALPHTLLATDGHEAEPRGFAFQAEPGTRRTSLQAALVKGSAWNEPYALVTGSAWNAPPPEAPASNFTLPIENS